MKKAVLIFLVAAGTLAAQDASSDLAGIDHRFGLGLYLGGQRTAGEIRPRESFDSPVSDPQLLLLGVTLKYKFAFLYVRAAAEGGLPVIGGKGNQSGSVAQEYNLTTMHAPVTFSLNFALSKRSSFYLGLGPSFHQLTLEMKSDTHETSNTVSASGLHFLLGAEVGLSDSGVFTLEWMRTSGITEAVGSGNNKDRVIGLAGNKLLLGFTYYFFI